MTTEAMPREERNSGPTEPAIRVRLRWRVFAVALVAVSALTSAAWLIHPPVYLTNDDVGTRLGLEGGFVPGQPPTGFVLHAHSVLGWALASLYGMLPNVPWWDLVLAGTLFWALAVLCALAWPALGSGWPPRMTALAAICAAGLPLIGTVQYTISATAAGVAATLLAVTEAAQAARTRRSVLVMAALLFLMGSLVRPMGAMAGALAVGLLLMPLAAVTRPTPRTVMGLAGVPLVAALAFTGLLSLDGALYGRWPDWNQYYQYNWMASQMFEWGGDSPGTTVDAMRASVGWSANDWHMLRTGWGVLPELHGFLSVAAAYETGAALVGWSERIGWIATRLAAVDGASLQRLGEASAGLLLVGGALAGAYGTRRSRAAVVLVVALFLGFCVALEVGFKELPFRLLAPLECGFLAVMLVSVGAHRRVPSPFVALLALSVVLAVLAHEGRAVASSMAADRLHALQVDGETERLLDLKPSLLVRHSDTFPAEHWWRPFHQPNIPLAMITLGGWTQAYNQSPQLQRFLSDTGRQPLPRALCEDPSILVVSELGRLEVVTTYLQEHENRQVEWEEAYAGSFRAWRCVDVTSPAS